MALAAVSYVLSSTGSPSIGGSPGPDVGEAPPRHNRVWAATIVSKDWVSHCVLRGLSSVPVQGLVLPAALQLRRFPPGSSSQRASCTGV